MLKKKLLSLWLVFCMLFVLTACAENNPQETIMPSVSTLFSDSEDPQIGDYVVPAETDFEVQEADGGFKIVKYIGIAHSIEIPAKIQGKDVVCIGDGAFSKSGVVGVKLPDTVLTIERSAFSHCTVLRQVVLGANVKTLGDQAFEGCTALYSLNLNDKLQSIGNLAFGGCGGLKDARLPSSLQTLGGGVFGLSGLERITISGSVASVSKQAFAACPNLKEVTIEEGAKIIEDQAFQHCEALNKVQLPKSLEKIGEAVFEGCDNVVLHGASGSFAQAYASEKDLAFEAVYH